VKEAHQGPLQPMCALRNHLRRGDGGPAGGLLQRLFRRPLTTHLLQTALEAGVAHASMSLGHMGLAAGGIDRLRTW